MMRAQRHHPRIYPANYPLLEKYDAQHAVVRALQSHAEACDVCVGREIEWPEFDRTAVDQSWFSKSRRKHQLFSAFAYEFLSYDLILDGWLEMAPEPTESELGFLIDDERRMRELLDECEEAANADSNSAVLPLVAKAREFVDIYKESILCRFRECGISWPVSTSSDS